MDNPPSAQTPRRPLPLLWLSIAAVVILVIAAAWYFSSRNNTPTNANQSLNTNTAAGTVYTNTALGFQLTLPPGWSTGDISGFSNADVLFQNATCKNNGCAIYVAREDNNAGLTVDAWLANVSSKDYMSQAEYDRRRSTGTPSERVQAGTYEQSTGQLGNQPALIQNYATEGGGYIRYFVSHAGSIYVLTLWSDGYYFNDTTKQNNFDGGQLSGEVDALVSSFTFLP